MTKALAAAALAVMLALPARAQVTSDPTWQAARSALAERVRSAGKSARAKNVILFVGDGMGVSTVTAARILDGQRKGRTGEENSLSFERLPHLALVKTYNVDAQVPDSAGTATAMTTGIKTNIGVLGMAASQSEKDCAAAAALPPTIAEQAKARGLGVGVVTTTRLTHATPAAMYAHSPSRDWESDAEVKASGCTGIARQLVQFKGGIDVALGGGLNRFRTGKDGDEDLTALWRSRHPRGHLLTSRPELTALKPQSAGPVLGLFNADHISYNLDRDPAAEPSLAELALFAVDKLAAQNPRGFVLMVEGGRIDHGHHITNPARALDETIEFSKAVEAVLARVNLRDTLVLVTADHSHVMTIAGYPKRGTPILGPVLPVARGEGSVKTGPDGAVLDLSGRPMPVIGYQNGPTVVTVGKATLAGNEPMGSPNYLPPKLHPLNSETHAGEDVPLYAAGPGATLVSGVIEQNLIYHIMTAALGWK